MDSLLNNLPVMSKNGQTQTYRKFRPLVLLAFVVFHLGAVAAFFFFTWPAFFVAVVLYLITGISVTVGYHRLLTHNSFETYPWIRRIFAFTGSLSAQGSPIKWIGWHRLHHEFSDQPGDPHSPNEGKWWAHIVWMLFPINIPDRYVSDLLKDRWIVKISRLTPYSQLLLGLSLGVGGYFFGGWLMALSFVLWAFFARTVFLWHFTWCINSVTHWLGSHDHDTKDMSTNNWWLAIPTFGESWHNNHHKYPTSARHGFKWWQIDPSYMLICLLKWMGLVWDVKVPKA